MAKYNNFDRGKYSNAFDQMFGQGSFDRGIQESQEIGRMKVEASLARKAFEKRQKEAEAERKKAEKEAAKAKAIEDSMKAKESSEKRKSNASTSKKKEEGALEKIGDFAKNAFSEAARFQNRALNTLSGGLLKDTLEKNAQNAIGDAAKNSFKKREGAGSVVDTVADFSGLLGGGLGATSLARGAGITGKGIKALEQAAKNKNVTGALVKTAAKDAAKEGALIGGGLTALESAGRVVNDESKGLLDELKRIGLATTVGAVADPLLTVAGPAGKLLAKNTMDNAIGKTAAESAKELENGPLARTVERRQMLGNDTSGRVTELLSRADNPATKRAVGDLNQAIRPRSSATDELTRLSNPRLSTAERAVGDPLQEIARRQSVESVLQPRASNTSFIDRNVKKEPKKVTTEIASVKKTLVNDLAKVAQIDKKMQEMDADGLIKYLEPKTLIKARTKQASVDSSLEKSLLNAKGAHSVSAQHVINRFKPFMEEVNKMSKDQVSKIGDYAFAKHGLKMLDNQAASRMERDALVEQLDQVKAELGANSEDAKMLEDLIESYKPYELPEGATADVLQRQLADFERDDTLVRQYNQFMKLQQENLKDMYDGGLISKPLYDTLKANDTYISMQRNFGNDSSLAGTGSKKVRTPLDTLRSGSSEMIKDPVTSAMRNAYITKFNIEKNNALKVVEKYAKIDSEGTTFKGVLKPNAKTITLFNNGKPKYYEVPEALKSYIDNFSADADPDILTNVLQKAAQMQRKLTTQYSISFQLKSLIREPVQAMMTSRTAKHSLDAAKNIAIGYVDALVGPQLQALTKNLPKRLQFDSFKQTWKDMGGSGFQYIRMSDEDLQKVAKEMMDSGTSKGNIKRLNPFNLVGMMGETVEGGARLGEFRSAKKQGYSDADAFYEATDITNYKRSGSAARELNKYIPYLNATIQGNERVLRALSEAPAKTIVRGVTTLSTSTVGIYSMRFMDGVSDEQRQELENLSDWEKDAYVHIPIPNSKLIIALPKPFVLGQMFMNPVERALDSYYEANMKDNSVPQQVKDGIKGILKSFAPPTDVAGYQTFKDLKNNKDSFTGFEIESKYDIDAAVPKQDREAYDQSYITKAIANFINAMTFSEEGTVSPAQVDFFVKDLIGTTGGQALDISDSTLNPNAPSKTIEDILLKPINQFRQDPTRASGRASDIKKLAAKESRNNVSMTGLSEEEKNVERSKRGAQNYDAAFKELNKAIQAVRSNASLSSKEKKEAITELRKEQDSLGSRAIDWYNSMK